MFDSFKHDLLDKKDSSPQKVAENLPDEIKCDTSEQIPSSEPQNEAAAMPKETAKDSKYNVKKMFDSFKHDLLDKKDSSPKKVAENLPDEIKCDTSEQIPSSEPQNEAAGIPKETAKDSKMKKMFDSFKHDFVDKKEGSSKTESDILQSEIKSNVPKEVTLIEPQRETSAVPKEATKDSKIKKMFDSFKHDFVDKKDSSSKKESDVFQSEIKSDITKGSSSPELHIETSALSKETTKDSKIKKMFDSFKHDFVDKKDSTSKKEPDISHGEVTSDAPKSHKDSKSGIKKFFGSLKQDGVSSGEISTTKVPETTAISNEGNKEPIDDTKNMKSSKYDGDLIDPYHKEFALPELTINPSPSESPVNQNEIENEQCQMSETEKTKQKDASHSVKKLFSAFKQEGPNTPKGDAKKFHVKFMERESSLKRSHSFKDSILIKESQSPEESEKKPKGSLQGVKKYFMSSKNEPQSSSSSKENGGKKSNLVKRSHSCRETAAEREGFHGIKSFFDSLSHKSPSKASSQSPVGQDNKGEEHIYDTVGQPESMSNILGSPKDNSKLVSPEIISVKRKDDNSSMKKLFDSFLNKDQSSKKIVSSDGVEKGSSSVLSTSGMNNESHVERTKIAERKEIKAMEKKREQLLDKSSDQQIQKDAPKVIIPSTEISKQKAEIINMPHIQVGGQSSSDAKTSVLSTLSDNFMAIKDKVLHSKDSKKNEVISNEKKSAEYDLEHAANQNDLQPSTSGTYKAIEDIPAVNKSFSQQEDMNKDGGLVCDQSTKPVSETAIPSSTSQHSFIPDPKTMYKVDVKTPNAGPGTPETLYDTCCLRLAVLLGKKAMEIVSDQTKIPPKKPPKPSAEAIAKARAAVVSKRLREIQNKGQSIGENIPVGYDGIRFADDETESSCDYKDLDNFDYIMDYELINRYKCDSKLDTFSDPSICSGISSYYTADTVTLKDEAFSDATLETVSLDNHDPHQHLSSLQNKTEVQTWPSSKKTRENRIKSVNNKAELSHKDKRSISGIGLQMICEMPASGKKIPPPIPPKPILPPKYTGSPNKVSMSTPDAKGSMSQCINGLSLSPRMQAKFSKDSIATKQRPLLVAGFKGTEFTSLQTKSKDGQNKQLRERTFNTVLKNESLKNVSTISSLPHQPLQSSKSSPSQLMDKHTSLTKKLSPQRPPLPNSVLSDNTKLKPKVVAPPVPEKPKRESRIVNSHASKEKRTVSPPRPPPPVLSKINVPPPRPPPPTPKPQIFDMSATDKYLEDQSKIFKSSELVTEQCDASLGDTRKDSISVYHDARESVDVSSENVALEILSRIGNSQISDGQSPLDSHEVKLGKDQSNSTFVSSSTDTPISVPKPPPRTRRIRSRTVEIVPKVKASESNLRRSQSLSDIDIQKKISHLDTIAVEKVDVKHLYTSVNKNGKRTVSDSFHSLNIEKVSGRPLPAPPPPPRKFRSLDRKPKDKQAKTDKDCSKSNEGNQIVQEAGSSNIFVKPPERKRKSDKQRFLSFSSERKRDKSEFESALENSKTPRSNSVPLRPDRKYKHANTEYDENANVAFPVTAEIHHSTVLLDECGNEIIEPSSSPNIPFEDAVDSKRDTSSSEKISPHPRQRKRRNPKKKSHSSWYDETHNIEESWEVVDCDPTCEVHEELRGKDSPGRKMPRRRQSDPSGSRIRQTSKFYVNVDHGDGGLPLLDKETSPLPIDCSEKSVQTSLETLSQGVASRDEQSEKSESSDNTDNLLSIVKTLQSELKVTLNRHKSLDDEDNDSSNVATDTATDTEKMDSREKKMLKTPSIPSSTSDLWPMSSSDESDGEEAHSGSVNLSEIALNRKKKKIFYIAQEIMTSEEVFVDTLKLLNVDFKAAVEVASKQRNTSVVPDEVLSQILNHLPQLQHLNENLLMELKDRIDNWDKTEKIADIIVKMGPFLKLYSWFIHDFESNLALLEESKKKYPSFAQVVKEFESTVRCKRLALNHYMLKPIQRIPQYRLLLQEYLHHLAEESPDYQDTVTALQIVSEVANHANESMKHGDNAQKLISIQNSIIGHKEIIKPGRLFLKEGVLMKLSRKGMQPRWFVLFNDLLLYLTPVQQGLYRINHELPLTGMKVAIPIQQDYQNEFSIISVTRSFTLAARSQEERQEWIVALTKAIEENASKRSTFTNIRLQQRVQDKNSEDDDGEFILGKKAPVWIPDSRVTMCQLCTSEFTVTFRRHHCRACGKVVCSICSGNRIPLHYLGGNKVNRVCDECYAKLGPDSSAFPESGETDSDNQQIAVKPHLRTEHRYVKKGKRNLPSVLKEVCANDQGSTISGYLQKRSGKSWKKEWFVVKDKVLYEYKASEDVAALRSIPLLGYQIESFSETFENVDSSLLFRLTHPGQAPIVFHADSVGSTERWIAALKEASVLE